MRAIALRDETGFTTTGMVIALLVSLALIFSTAQVYRISSISADVQDVADAVALAAENEVAEFVLAARVCDAVVLTLSLTSVAATGLGVAALCVPAAVEIGDKLIAVGRDVSRARDAFSRRAVDGLGVMQRALPFLAAANGAVVARENSVAEDADYLGLALLVPFEGESVSGGGEGSLEELEDAVDGGSEELAEAGRRAQEAAADMGTAKERAYRHDCGDAPGYCLYERAAQLTEMSGTDNPLFRSVDTWSFSVALERAKSYYAARLAAEHPASSSVDEQARSALRLRFYQYAYDQVSQGYVYETGDSFEAWFPRLPKNTDDMRATELYREQAYPQTLEEGLPVLHAWSGCPRAVGVTGLGSLEEAESLGFETCPVCSFTAASLGKVAAASSSIENGFEYHYEIVAEASEEYARARKSFEPAAEDARGKAKGLIDLCKIALGDAASQRITVRPPGSQGSIALVVARGSSAAGRFASPFVRSDATLRARVAISSATLVEQSAGEGGDVISSLLDGFSPSGNAALGAGRIVLDCWSGFLRFYGEGQRAIDDTVRSAIDAIPFASESGLGTWAANLFADTVLSLGLQPAELGALEPLIVNAAHVAGGGDDAPYARLIDVKRQAIEHPASSTDPFLSLFDGIEVAALDEIERWEEGVEIASVELLDGTLVIPITIALPPSISSVGSDFVENAMGALKALYVGVTGVRVWE